MSEKKICPIMSGPPVMEDIPPTPGVPQYRDKRVVSTGLQECQKYSCQLWLEVYTTEGQRHTGCAFELQPQMVDGLFRV